MQKQHFLLESIPPLTWPIFMVVVVRRTVRYCPKNRPDLREKMWIQSKCSICIEEFTYFDFSKDYIIKSVDGICKDLKIDHLDGLLHRPDVLMGLIQVAEAFDLLYKQGKVRDFGVSNQTYDDGVA